MKLICCCITRNRGTGSKTDGSSFLINALNSYEETVGCDSGLVVVDDASNDDTADLLESWPTTAGAGDLNPRVVLNAKHHGIGGAMNEFVLPEADPDDILVRFDDDILFLCPGWGQRVLDTFAAAGAARLCGGPELVSLGGRQIDPRGFIQCFGDRIIGPRYRHLYAGASPTAHDESQPNVDFLFPVQSVMGAFCAFRASALKAIGGYDPRFAKLRCETEDVHVSFMERGWKTAVRFGLDITHWSDRRIAHEREGKAWGVENLDETWLRKWRFMRTGLTLLNEFNPHLSALRISQIVNHPSERIRARLNDLDFDEVPGMVGANTRCWLPAVTPTVPGKPS